MEYVLLLLTISGFSAIYLLLNKTLQNEVLKIRNDLQRIHAEIQSTYNEVQSTFVEVQSAHSEIADTRSEVLRLPGQIDQLVDMPAVMPDSKANSNSKVLEDLFSQLIRFLEDIQTTSKTNSIYPRKEKDRAERFKAMLPGIFAYGSGDLINIAVGAHENSSFYTDSHTAALYLSLMICQMKYDMTGEMTNPDLWLRIWLKDYGASKAAYANACNEIADSLCLDGFLRIKVD